MGLCCGRGVYGFDLVLRFGVCWRFLLMMGIRVKVETVDL